MWEAICYRSILFCSTSHWFVTLRPWTFRVSRIISRCCSIHIFNYVFIRVFVVVGVVDVDVWYLSLAFPLPLEGYLHGQLTWIDSENKVFLEFPLSWMELMKMSKRHVYFVGRIHILPHPHTSLLTSVGRCSPLFLTGSMVVIQSN